MDIINNTNVTKKQYTSNIIRRLLIEKVVEDGVSLTIAADELKLKITTAFDIVSTYKKSSRTDCSTVRGKPPLKVTPEVLTLIEQTLEWNHTITLALMKETISNILGVHLSLETIRKGIISLGITLKRNGIILDRVNDPARIQLRKEYATNFLTSAPIDDMKNIFIDESGFNLHMRRNYGRTLVGTRSASTVPTIRGRNVTLLSAINAGGVIHYKIFVGSCTSAIFSEFVLQVDEIMQNELNICNGFIYMDNAKAHTAANSRNAMNTMVNGFVFLSPYSYMLNPIEFSYSKIKACVRNLLQNADGMELPQLIAMGIASISETDASGWYRLIRRNCALAMQEYVFK